MISLASVKSGTDRYLKLPIRGCVYSFKKKKKKTQLMWFLQFLAQIHNGFDIIRQAFKLIDL